MAVKRRAISTVLKGVTFEQRSVGILRDHLSMSLRRVGGKGDGGIDLQGWWWLPSHCLAHARSHDVCKSSQEAANRTPLRVLGQCKAEEKKIGPRYIREFEGVVLRHSAYLAANESGGPLTGCLRSIVVGLFVSASPFTKASHLEVYSSPIPLALMHLPEPPDPSESSPVPEPDFPGTLVFNPALSGENGLFSAHLEARWERSPVSGGGRPGLWSEGQRIESWIPAVGGDGESGA
ncbi:hypothetical protein GSI_10774 [Ganoderma sinense ZZ0214-1]|uniref:Uncharacterized protein n=1 Tax=Ganoderma sinense ZZ0214-1 TaxID=1077348 RepID=A0A2G8S1H7_9APHY|nr:hypothetical protein GSI_10774 [Ganoderma sinense ZZ0214-1]